MVYEDGLAGQTPEDFFVGLSEYHLMRSVDDPDPVLCFKHTGPVEADLYGDNLVGLCRTDSIPSGIYTHGRVKVDWVRYSVAGNLHYLDAPYSGRFSFFRAYSDTVFEGEAFLANEGKLAFSTGAAQDEIPWLFPDPEPMDGIPLELVDGELWMTFEYTNPLPIDQTNLDPHWTRFYWKIFDAFRWSDRTLTDYAMNRWDVSMVLDETEEVILTGVAGYYITSSVY